MENALVLKHHFKSVENIEASLHAMLAIYDLAVMFRFAALGQFGAAFYYMRRSALHGTYSAVWAVVDKEKRMRAYAGYVVKDLLTRKL